MEEQYDQIFIPYERSSQFSEEKKNGWWGAIPSEILSQPHSIGEKSPILNRYLLLEPQPYDLAKKSPTRFPVNLTRSSYVAPKSPKGGGLKNATRLTSVQNRTSLEESAICVISLCENCQRQSCKAFIGLTINVNMIDGGCLLLLEILGQTDRVGAKSQIFLSIFAIAPQP